MHFWLKNYTAILEVAWETHIPPPFRTSREFYNETFSSRKWPLNHRTSSIRRVTLRRFALRSIHFLSGSKTKTTIGINIRIYTLTIFVITNTPNTVYLQIQNCAPGLCFQRPSGCLCLMVFYFHMFVCMHVARVCVNVKCERDAAIAYLGRLINWCAKRASRSLSMLELNIQAGVGCFVLVPDGRFRFHFIHSSTRIYSVSYKHITFY